MSDELLAYNGLSDEYVHKIINHSVEYVKGEIHTNSMENFWSLGQTAIERELYQRRAVPPVSSP
jgi:hypothetical protein